MLQPLLKLTTGIFCLIIITQSFSLLRRTRNIRVLEALLLAGLAICVVHPALSNLSPFSISDSLEYFAAALSTHHDGRYALRLDETLYPPRYPPWFSLLAVFPEMLITGGELRYFFQIAFFAALAAITAAVTSESVCGRRAAYIAVLAVLLPPNFRYFGSQLLTDMPSAALALALCCLYVTAPRDKARNFGTAGILLAVAAAFRPANSIFMLPFMFDLLRAPRGRASTSALLLAPPAAVFGAGLAYNYFSTGDPLRTGYHLWVAIPYDSIASTFSFAYVVRNIGVVVQSTSIPLYLLLSASAPSIRRWASLKAGSSGVDEAPYRRLLLFNLICVPPQILVYLLYFYPTPRFYLPAESLLGLQAAVTAAVIFNVKRFPQAILSAVSVLLLTVLAVYRPRSADTLPELRKVAQMPEQATILTGRNPLIFQARFPERRDLRIVPISRRVEFASKRINWRRVDIPIPLVHDIEMINSLMATTPGAVVYPKVGLEDPQIISSAGHGGSAVLADVDSLDASELSLLLEHFVLQEAPLLAPFKLLVPK